MKEKNGNRIRVVIGNKYALVAANETTIATTTTTTPTITFISAATEVASYSLTIRADPIHGHGFLALQIYTCIYI